MLRPIPVLDRLAPEDPVARRRHRPRPSARRAIRDLERLEAREVLSTFTVSSPGSAGTGSLRQAILDANAAPGADTIQFSITGTIRIRGAALPTVRGQVTIDGTSAPGYASSPVVTVDFARTRGLVFDSGSGGSTLKGLSIVRAAGAGVTLRSSGNTVAGNYIGLLADGKTAAGNLGDGILVEARSHGNLIGRQDPVSGTNYYDASQVPTQPVSGWQGIRAASTPGQYLITGTSGSNGLLYVGPITGSGGTSYLVNYPGAATTSVYGPDLLSNGNIRLVGSYRTGSDAVNGFVYEGSIADLSNAANYRTIAYSGEQFNYVHSTMGGLAVGNTDGPEGNLPIGTGHAFLYDLATNSFLPDVVYPGSLSTTAYGIWWNGGTSYTIAGGYSSPAGTGSLSKAYLVDYDSSTRAFTHWASYSVRDGIDLVSHFQGISSVEKGVYTLSADVASITATNPGQGAAGSVRRNTDGSFGPAVWTDLQYTNSTGITSNDSIYGNAVVGIVISSAGTFCYQAQINVGFQLSNVISGNRGNGVTIDGGSENLVAMNFIGTDATGTVRLGNAREGVRLTNGAARNLIGGQATGGNDPTAGVFVRPPQGNLISANGRNGVLIDRGATANVLSGNFVGTAASGNSALGNRLDGVAIDGADGNALLGCTYPQSPFVFYNVISGNRGNGVTVHNSDQITIHANFLGVGANNATVVANGRNGLLVSGSSKYTQVGGVIPLGNVISGNNANGIEVRDTASGFVSFNTFGGVYAFGGAAPNRRNGILITSRGGNNLIRTSILGGNLGNGIEIGGDATGVQVTDTGIGTDTALSAAIPNGGSGILITGRAHDNAIGGYQPSIEPSNTISGNGRYGIEVAGKARRNRIVHSMIGASSLGTKDIGNALGGILLGPGSSFTTIGGDFDVLRNTIAYSKQGSGIRILSSKGNQVIRNDIRNNSGFGITATGNCRVTVLRRNLIASNTAGAVNLAGSKGVVYIP
ncbi:MAG: right-handed parallel beta-helix repeat-containing protein [Isosphaeraceae bacterium]